MADEPCQNCDVGQPQTWDGREGGSDYYYTEGEPPVYMCQGCENGQGEEEEWHFLVPDGGCFCCTSASLDSTAGLEQASAEWWQENGEPKTWSVYVQGKGMKTSLLMSAGMFDRTTGLLTRGFDEENVQTFSAVAERRLEDVDERRLFKPEQWRLKLKKKLINAKASAFRKGQIKEMFVDVEIPAKKIDGEKSRTATFRAKIDSFDMKKSIEDLKVIGSAMGGTWTFLLDCTSDEHNSDCVAKVYNEKYYYDDKDGARNLNGVKVTKQKMFRGVAGSKVCHMADTLKNKRDNC
jgi:hypothetical protein